MKVLLKRSETSYTFLYFQCNRRTRESKNHMIFMNSLLTRSLLNRL